jgi:hypothetical protein
LLRRDSPRGELEIRFADILRGYMRKHFIGKEVSLMEWLDSDDMPPEEGKMPAEDEDEDEDEDD